MGKSPHLHNISNTSFTAYLAPTTQTRQVTELVLRTRPLKIVLQSLLEGGGGEGGLLSNKNELNTTFSPQPGSNRSESGRGRIATKGHELEPKVAFMPSALRLMWYRRPHLYETGSTPVIPKGGCQVLPGNSEILPSSPHGAEILTLGFRQLWLCKLPMKNATLISETGSFQQTTTWTSALHLGGDTGWQPLTRVWEDKNLKCVSKVATKELGKETGNEWIGIWCYHFIIHISRSAAINHRKGTTDPIPH